jgi:hypothetical protein
MTIEEISEEFNISINEGVMNLGWENGWSDNTIEGYRLLRKLAVPGSGMRSGEASWQKIWFDVKDENQEVRVTYQLDSGD